MEGKDHFLNEACFISAYIEGLPVEFEAYVIDEIGKVATGKEIELLFGALAMQKWGIHPLPNKEGLDLTHYSKEFLGF